MTNRSKIKIFAFRIWNKRNRMLDVNKVTILQLGQRKFTYKRTYIPLTGNILPKLSK